VAFHIGVSLCIAGLVFLFLSPNIELRIFLEGMALILGGFVLGSAGVARFFILWFS